MARRHVALPRTCVRAPFIHELAPLTRQHPAQIDGERHIPPRGSRHAGPPSAPPTSTAAHRPAHPHAIQRYQAGYPVGLDDQINSGIAVLPRVGVGRWFVRSAFSWKSYSRRNGTRLLRAANSCVPSSRLSAVSRQSCRLASSPRQRLRPDHEGRSLWRVTRTRVDVAVRVAADVLQRRLRTAVAR